MSNLIDDTELTEGYWRALLEEAEQQPVSASRMSGSAPRPQSATIPAASPPHPAAEPRDAHDPMDADWAEVERAHDTGTYLEVAVTGCNRGGLIVVYRSLRGFVPSSHVHSINPDCDEFERRSNLAGNIGNTLQVRVIEIDPAQDRIVFSERAQDAAEPLREIPQVLFTLSPGDNCHGVVTNLTAFGAFVDLGGYEGLVHVSELAWSRVNHPRDLLTIGQDVNVQVMSISAQEGRIALSLKRAQQNPWVGVERRYQVGQIVRGMVTNVVQFGAFVKVEEDLEGLVHVSELADGSFLHPRNIVHEGQEVSARVIGVNAQQRRLALSMRNVGAP